ncbi:MAG: hypothetical protein AAGJ81_11520 [Verrucomicrobiota bacterium]
MSQPFYLRPGEWGEKSRKVEVLLAKERAAVLVQPEPNPESTADQATTTLQTVLRQRISERQPPPFASNWTGASAIFSLPCPGPVVFAGDRETYSTLREEYGSEQWSLHFLLLVRKGPQKDFLSCDLPVALHRDGTRSLISHKTGKQAKTVFKRVHDESTLSLWLAQTSFLRPDQIRLHAAECGLEIAGESIYGSVEPLTREDLPGQRHPGGKGFVLVAGPAIHLLHLFIPSLSPIAFHGRPSKPIQKWIDSQAGLVDLEVSQEL